MPAQNNPKIKPKRETIETDRAAFFIRRFLPVYAAYLTPLWICLYTDEGQEAKSLQLGQVCKRMIWKCHCFRRHMIKTPYLPDQSWFQVHDSFLWLCVWWIVVSICYGSLRHILPHPRVNAKFHKKEAHLHKQVYCILTHLATFKVVLIFKFLVLRTCFPYPIHLCVSLYRLLCIMCVTVIAPKRKEKLVHATLSVLLRLFKGKCITFAHQIAYSV